MTHKTAQAAVPAPVCVTYAVIIFKRELVLYLPSARALLAECDVLLDLRVLGCDLSYCAVSCQSLKRCVYLLAQLGVVLAESDSVLLASEVLWALVTSTATASIAPALRSVIAIVYVS